MKMLDYSHFKLAMLGTIIESKKQDQDFLKGP